jgi:hypothetical protein
MDRTMELWHLAQAEERVARGMFPIKKCVS